MSFFAGGTLVQRRVTSSARIPWLGEVMWSKVRCVGTQQRRQGSERGFLVKSEFELYEILDIGTVGEIFQGGGKKIAVMYAAQTFAKMDLHEI